MFWEISYRFLALCLFLCAPVIYFVAYFHLAEGDYGWTLYNMIFAGFGWFYATHLWEWSKEYN